MEKTEIKKTIRLGRSYYIKNCPWRINNDSELVNDFQIPVIRAVGSPLCQRCEFFVKINNGYVYCN